MGGMERASVNLAHSILGLGHEVIYVSLFNQEKFFQLDDKIRFIEPDLFNKNSLSFFKSIKWIRKNCSTDFSR